ncbi:alpha/beta hydrolase [Loktanella sp. Alg231-35]|uniref:alpha/beta hydrolase n=1 Tax=Loktanella sp. Alg231-35 TaxID=1922220 RepID=UPI000D556023|nr:alpha/beta hydrolase [Loktanella sp. Alg231-35]
MLIGVYLLYGVAMVFAHPQFIYPFGADPFANPNYTQEVVTERRVAMAWRDGDADTAVLFFMGNGGALTYFTYTLDAHEQAGRMIAAMEYPGGGGIPGTPSEVRLKADALAAYDWLAARHAGPIVVHGYSMGSGLALHVAAARPVAAVLLDAPFVKMCELMTKASWLPACYMPGVQHWNSAALVPDVTAPVLIQHGTEDQLIEMSNGERLRDLMAAAGLAVTFHAVEGATHNNLAGQVGYANRIDQFLSGLQ